MGETSSPLLMPDVWSRRNYATTFLAEGAVLVSALLVYRLVARGYGPEAFAAYALARRALTLLQPFGALGLDVAIPRFTALALAQGSRDAGTYLVSGLVIATSAVAATSALLLGLRGPFTDLFFGSPSLVELTLALPVLLVGGALHIVAYGGLRGYSRIGRANALMVANHGLLPIGSIALAGGSLPRLLALLGIGWAILSLVALAASPKSTRLLRARSVELIGYGLRRVPGDFVQLLFFALPAILVAHVATLQEAGIVALALAGLSLVGSGLTPISFVLLPIASNMVGRGAHEQLRSHVTAIVRLVVPLLILGVALVELFADQLLQVYLGAEFVRGAGSLRIVMLAAIPWGLYVVLKSLLDARHFAPVNARNVAVAFAVFAVIAVPAALLSTGSAVVLAAFVLGMYVLGILTTIEADRSLLPARRFSSAKRRDGDVGAAD